MDEIDHRLKEIFDRLRGFEVKDASKMRKVSSLNEKCSSLLSLAAEKRCALLGGLEKEVESGVRIKEVERIIENFDPKFTIPSQSTSTINCQSVDTQILNHFVKHLRFIVSKGEDLHRGRKILESLKETNHLKNKLDKLKKQVDLIAGQNGMLDSSLRLLELCDELNSKIDKNPEGNLNKIEELKRLKEKAHRVRVGFEEALISLEINGVGLMDTSKSREVFLDPVEKFLSSLIVECESLSELQRRYSTLCEQIETSLGDIEAKLNDYGRTTAKLLSLGESLEFERLEAKFNYYKGVKAFLCGAQLKADIESVQKMGVRLISGRHEPLRIRYLELLYRIDQEMKSVEIEFTEWKGILAKCAKIIDFVKQMHQTLASVSLSRFLSNLIKIL